MATIPSATVPESPEPAWDLVPAPVPTGDELAEIILNLPSEDQHAIGKLVSRALSTNRPLDTVTLVHESLKANIDELIAGEYDEIQSKTAPPVIKRYPGSVRVPLSKDFLPLSFTLDRVIDARASRRDFVRAPMTEPELSTLLHYAYGIRRYMSAYNTRQFPLRMVPSSGSLQAVEIYLVVNGVEGIPRGLYHYDPIDHALELLDEGNMRRKVVGVSIMQEWLTYAGVVLLLSCVMSRAEWKYKARGYRYVHIDTGVLTGQLYLVATALRLRCCAVAAFIDDAVNELLDLDGRGEFVALMMGVGTRPDHEAGASA